MTTETRDLRTMPVRSRIPVLVLLLLATTSGDLPAQNPPQAAWKILEDGVNETSTDRRAMAVRALGLLLPEEHRAVAFAETALGDEKAPVRTAAATALGEMHSRASIPKLRKALSDPDGTVVLAAAEALVTLKDNHGYDAYYAVLTGRRKTGRGRVSEELAMLRDPKKLAKFSFEEGIGFVPFGGLGFSAFTALTKDDVSPVRAAAARVLATDPDPRSGEALGLAVADKHGIVRAAAVQAIAKRGDAALVSDVLPALSDENDGVRYTAAAAIIRLTMVVEGPKHAHTGSGKSSKKR